MRTSKPDHMTSLDELDEGRPPTPPHHPIAGVRILRQEIEAIIASGFPEYELISIEQIPPGDSYNNRIYFLQLRHAVQSPASRIDKVVLKVNGRFFGANKIQNEVACLQILEKYCPDVPSPRVLAWSGDGEVATFVTSSQAIKVSLGESIEFGKREHGGWIIMSYVPGNPISAVELDSQALMDLGRQLGNIIACIRKDVPAQNLCGNVRIPHIEPGNNSLLAIDSANFTIQDIIHEGIESLEPITNVADYYRIRLQGKLKKLTTSDVFAANGCLMEPARVFMSTELPNLQLTHGSDIQPQKFIFTHYDLSPRNVLISGQPPRITGIVDFEFAGFFSPLDEFLNDEVVNDGKEWPQEFYKEYLARLEERGIATPAGGFDANIWRRNCLLEALIGNIAPWYLPGDLKGRELRAKLQEAETTALNILCELRENNQDDSK
jgi:hypothetical protein